MGELTKAAIGQDSHRFAAQMPEQAQIDERRTLILGGVEFPGEPPLEGNSDCDVVLHALCNAISGITCVNILGEVADRMCLVEGITDSSAYVKEAMKYLGADKIVHVSFSIECARPAISPKIREMREYIASLLGIGTGGVGITATSGEGLTDFGRGLGIQVFCIIAATSKMGA